MGKQAQKGAGSFLESLKYMAGKCRGHKTLPRTPLALRYPTPHTVST